MLRDGTPGLRCAQPRRSRSERAAEDATRAAQGAWPGLPRRDGHASLNVRQSIGVAYEFTLSPYVVY